MQDYSDPYWQWQFPAMILSVFGADFILCVSPSYGASRTGQRGTTRPDICRWRSACGILYVSQVAGPGHQALAGSIFNMSTRELPPQPAAEADDVADRGRSTRAEIGTGFGLAINTIVQDKVTKRRVEQLGQAYDPNAVGPNGRLVLHLDCD